MTQGSAPKNKRAITSFEADSDVDEMINAAQDDGVTIKELLNEALRQHGVSVIREILEQKTERLKRWKKSEPSSAKASGSAKPIRLMPPDTHKKGYGKAHQSKPQSPSGKDA